MWRSLVVDEIGITDAKVSMEVSQLDTVLAPSGDNPALVGSDHPRVEPGKVDVVLARLRSHPAPSFTIKFRRSNVPARAVDLDLAGTALQHKRAGQRPATTGQARNHKLREIDLEDFGRDSLQNAFELRRNLCRNGLVDLKQVRSDSRPDRI